MGFQFRQHMPANFSINKITLIEGVSSEEQLVILHLDDMHICIQVLKLVFGFYTRVHVTNYLYAYAHAIQMNDYQSVP